ncbi:MAG: dephospho-CoA kinase [Saprospiraceae bacterium]|nr:dephospho-CoA kinase [Saprospiraceae bacterium]MDW8230235.1 dephospho-CoA kinase [Saprospiraceae bacterium]
MDHPLRVGITGGIGSGKTTVCRLFSVLGIPVYDADYWAKWLIKNDPQVRRGVIALLGPEAYQADGAYNRAYVARRVFADANLLAALNAVVHPAVERHSRAWHEQQALSGCPYTLKEAALLVESGSHRFLDALIVVTAPEEVRIRRVMERDGVAEEVVRARLRHQAPEAEKVALADFVILNDGQHALIPQVWRIHRTLVARAHQQTSA